MGKQWKHWQIFIFLGSRITADGDWSHEIKRHLLFGKTPMTNLDSGIKSRDIALLKGLFSHSYGFSSTHAWLWELYHKEGWVPKNWYCQDVVLEKALENFLDRKEIKAINPEENQSWIFIGGTNAEATILWPADANSQLTGKDHNAGIDWRQEEKGSIEDETVGWHHQLNGHEFWQTPGDSEGQGGLACCPS